MVKNCGLKPSGLPSEQYTRVLAAKAAPAQLSKALAASVESVNPRSFMGGSRKLNGEALRESEGLNDRRRAKPQTLVFPLAICLPACVAAGAQARNCSTVSHSGAAATKASVENTVAAVISASSAW